MKKWSLNYAIKPRGRTEIAFWRHKIKASLIERVAGDGQEDGEEGVVTREGQEDKVDGELEAAPGHPARGIDGSVHYIVPVLLRQHLEKKY